MKKVLLVALLGFFVSACEGSEAKQKRKMVADALYLCQESILSLAKYGDAERPPYREPETTKNAVMFEWERGAFHFKNGFGAKDPQSAACYVHHGKITYLEISGDTLISS